MQQYEAAMDLIKRWEGLSLSPYICPGGHPTIGYGHLITEREKRQGKWQEPILIEEAELLFERDFFKHLQLTLGATPGVELNPHQLGVLTSFVFNLGIGNYRSSTLRKRVLDGDHADVPYQLSRWVFAGGRRLQGLVNRRRDEAALYQRPYGP